MLLRLVLSLGLVVPGQPQAHDSSLARRLRWAALDQQAVLNLDSALSLLQAARRADPAYFPAQYDYVELRRARYEDAVLRRESAALVRSSDPGERCLGLAITERVDGRRVFQDLSSLERSAGATTCTTVYRAVEPLNPAHADFPDSERDAALTRALAVAPEIGAVWGMYANFLESLHRSRDAERNLERGQQAVQHALLRMYLAGSQPSLRLARGDTAGAVAMRRALRAAVERDGRVGIAAIYLDADPCSRLVWVGSTEDQNARQRSVVNRARAPGDWAVVVRILLGCGHARIDRGDPAAALVYVNRAIAVADSTRLPDLCLEAYTQRARTLVQLGRLADAERDQRRGLELGKDAGWQYRVADAYHNLAHIYESEGRWSDAVRAIDHFGALAKPVQDGLYLTSRIDAGELRWKAGWHAAARDAFDELVRVVDEQNWEHYWAGAYYDRIGDLDRARRYYEKARLETGWDSRAQTALAHLYEDLGQLDSAESVARIHDSREALWAPLEVPLVPAILARRGQSTDAIRTVQSWAVRQEARGNVHGSTMAYLEVARVALDGKSPNIAAVAALHAESLATGQHLRSERTRAMTLRGIALGLRGADDSAVVVLRTATALAKLDSTQDNLFETQLVLGDVLSRRGEIGPAIAAYDGAAAAAERVTRSFAVDLDRARYRDRHLLPFDGAVKALLLGADNATRLPELLAWSARRKAAALALATRDTAQRGAAHRPQISVAGLRRAIGEHDAVLDYLVIDSMVAVVVITRERTTVVRLPVSTDSLHAMTERLRRPFVTVYAGRLDLARAPFSLETAAALHAALVAPLASALAGKTKLVISPDGPLHALPFDALVTAGPASGHARDYAAAKYILDAYETEYVPSLAFLGPRQSQQALSLASARLLVVSYAAPGSEQESRAILAAWPGHPSVALEGAQATERAAKIAMPSFDVIHFAVHGAASARDPLASHLRLAADSLDDGYLHLGEIAALKLNAKLVVLSACETDAGQIYNGEGVMGLARAFLGSGAHAVVGTQWMIGPETGTLMTEFYRRLAMEGSPSSSLRRAKLSMRMAPGTSHPFYWAGTVLLAGRADR